MHSKSEKHALFKRSIHFHFSIYIIFKKVKLLIITIFKSANFLSIFVETVKKIIILLLF